MVTERVSVNGKPYEILKLLGKGKGGYSYLASDGNARVVVKQIHHEPCPYYQFGNKIEAEINDYQRLRAIGIALPRLLDVDLARERIVKEYIDGETAHEMILHDRLPAWCLERMQDICALLYPAGLNIDYFPTNFVAREHTLYYIDYECNAYSDEWNFENWGVKYWSKTPEWMDYVKNH